MLKIIRKYPLRFWIILISIFLITRITAILSPLDDDHWFYYMLGHDFVKTGTMYLNTWDHKAPLIFMFYGLIDSLFGSNVIWHRIFYTGFGLVQIYLYFVLLQQFAKRFSFSATNLSSKVSIIIFVALTSLTRFNASGFSLEGLALLILLIYYGIYFRKEEYTAKTLLVQGLLAALLIYLKPQYILFVIPSINMFFVRGSWKSLKTVKNAAIYAVPTMILTIILLLYFKATGALDSFLMAAITYPAKYARMAFDGGLSDLITLFAINSPFYALLGIYLFITVRSIVNKEKLGWFFKFSIVACVIYVLILANMFTYYYLPLILFISLLAAYFQTFTSKKLTLIVIALLILVNTGFSYKNMLNTFTGSTRSAQTDLEQASTYIKSHSNENDSIYAFNYSPYIYVLSERDNASRYISASYACFDYIYKFGFNINSEVMKEVAARKPKFILISSKEGTIYQKNLPLKNFLMNGYHLVKSYDSFDLMEID